MTRKPIGASKGTSKVGAPKTGGGGSRQLKVRVKNHKHTGSSREWLQRHLNDPYVQASKRDGWRSRAAYKLLEIDDKYSILKPGQQLVDLGAAPGGWAQVAADRVHATAGEGRSAGKLGRVVAIDYLAFDPISGVEILELDFTDAGVEDKLKSLLRDSRADVVLSDMAAPTTGHTHTDHLRIMGLAELAYAFAADVLTPGGAFLCKVFQGGSESSLLKTLKRDFTTVRHVKPPASRAESAELYVLATGFRSSAARPHHDRNRRRLHFSRSARSGKAIARP
jgi:23S rRNA (uridine2552-2'-O)-methyltransferase